MREFLVRLFRDDTFGPKMGLFNLTHILYLLFVVALVVLFVILFNKKDKTVKSRVLDILLGIVICLYFGDFFIHPLMNNENALIVDKLPFHLCTASCILIFLARFGRKQFESVYFVPVILGMVGALMYIAAPTGVADEYLFCYRTLQTMAYHGALFMFGILSLIYGDIKLSIKNYYKIPIFIAIQIVISLFANKIYSVEDHHYDWYFTTGTSFGMNEVAMPFIIFGIINAVCLLVYGIYYLCLFIKKKKVN